MLSMVRVVRLAINLIFLIYKGKAKFKFKLLFELKDKS